MWLERFLIIVPGLQYKQAATFSWGSYMPSAAEGVFVLGTFCFVGLLLLIFSKFFPLIPLFDIKEGKVLTTEIQVGRVGVPAVYREE